jgi:hypothetical protein
MPRHHYTTITFLILGALVFSASGQAMQVGENSLGMSGDLHLKWIGKGIQGKLIDAEVVLSEAMIADSSKLGGSDYDGRFRVRTTQALVNFYVHPGKILDLKLSMPFVVKQGADGKTGPFGDMLLDVSRTWGTLHMIAAGLTLNLPTGYSTIMSDDTHFLSTESQLGNGLFGATARASYGFAPDWGIVDVGASYSAGLFAIRTSDYGYNPTTDQINYDKKSFEVARDGWGARNDAGVVTPDRIGVFVDLGIKTETVNHGFCIGYYYPTQFVSNYETLAKGSTSATFATKALAQASLDAGDTVANTTYYVAGQRSDSTWEYLARTTVGQRVFPSLTLQYSLEKTDMVFPIFLGGMVKMDYNNRLNFSGFSLGIGFKFPVI